jgi:cytochrome c biogenesis protein CcmG/thiol:disulfide interchange protein DsbE
MQKRILLLVFGIALIAAACSAASDITPGDAPEPITFDELTAEIGASGRPTIVNVWASWCLPCRSEAPLLATAAATRTKVDFIALNIRDNPRDAAAFIAQYYDNAPMIHYEDRSGTIPVEMGGGRGVPITFFYSADATLVQIHRGIIDEPTLAFFLDEIQR